LQATKGKEFTEDFSNKENQLLVLGVTDLPSL